ATRAVVQRDVRLGLVEPERLRFTIEARKQEAKRLIDEGMSQRQAAKVLGVSHTTVQADLADDLPKGGKKSADYGHDPEPYTLSPEQMAARHARDAARRHVTAIQDALVCLDCGCGNPDDHADALLEEAELISMSLSADTFERCALYLAACANRIRRK
ncbi:MAG: helix-turn-helix domain-containing protein, partial [Terriglobales bacterium]